MPSYSGHSSGHPSESGTDWWQESLTPSYLKRKPGPTMEELPSVEAETPEQVTERKKEPELAIHMTMLEHYDREVK